MTMLVGAALAAFLSAQPDSGLDRLRLYLSSSPAFEAKGKTTVRVVGQEGGPSSGHDFSLRWQSDSMHQIYKSGPFEMRQTEEALLLFNHSSKMYQEYRGMRYPASPDPEAFFMETVGYPFFFTVLPRLIPTMAGSEWKRTPKDGGWVMSGEWSSPNSGESVEVTLNDRGLPSRIIRKINVMDSSFEVEHRIDSIIGVPREAPPSLHPLEGYTAHSLTQFYTPSPGMPLSKEPLVESNGNAVEYASLMGGKGVTILFTAADCDLSARFREDFAKIKADLDRAGYPLVEVALGRQAPAKSFSGARLFHDASHRLEWRWAIPSTPYLLTVDKEGTVMGAWEGWWSGCRSEALKSLTEEAPI